MLHCLLILLCSPIEELLHTMRNTLQSSSFLASCGAIFQSLLCSLRLAKLQDCKYYYWLIGLMAGMGILIEKKPRRSELALYVQLLKHLHTDIRIIYFRFVGITKGYSSSLSIIII